MMETTKTGDFRQAPVIVATRRLTDLPHFWMAATLSTKDQCIGDAHVYCITT